MDLYSRCCCSHVGGSTRRLHTSLRSIAENSIRLLQSCKDRAGVDGGTSEHGGIPQLVRTLHC